MTRGTMDGKATVELPPVTVMQQAEDASRDSGDGRKSRVNRKYVIIGVTCAVVAGMVIAGVLVGVKFHLNSTADIVEHTYEFKKEDGQSVKEDISADVKDNYVQYHLKDDDSEVWVIDDFNRELKVMKVKEAAGSKCYISILNRSDNALPKAVLNATAPHDKVETEKSSYEMLETPIKDKSMLNTQAQKLCENIDVSWMTPTCATDSNDHAGGRVKRALHQSCCRYICYYPVYCFDDGQCFWLRLCRNVCYSCPDTISTLLAFVPSSNPQTPTVPEPTSMLSLITRVSNPVEPSSVPQTPTVPETISTLSLILGHSEPPTRDSTPVVPSSVPQSSPTVPEPTKRIQMP